MCYQIAANLISYFTDYFYNFLPNSCLKSITNYFKYSIKLYFLDMFKVYKSNPPLRRAENFKFLYIHFLELH